MIFNKLSIFGLILLNVNLTSCSSNSGSKPEEFDIPRETNDEETERVENMIIADIQNLGYDKSSLIKMLEKVNVPKHPRVASAARNKLSANWAAIRPIILQIKGEHVDIPGDHDLHRIQYRSEIRKAVETMINLNG